MDGSITLDAKTLAVIGGKVNIPAGLLDVKKMSRGMHASRRRGKNRQARVRPSSPVLPDPLRRRMRWPLVNVRTWFAVSVYVVIAQAFVALKNGTGPHTGERRFKCGHNFTATPLGLP